MLRPLVQGPKAHRPCSRYLRQSDGDLRGTAESQGQASGPAERQDHRGRVLRRPGSRPRSLAGPLPHGRAAPARQRLGNFRDGIFDQDSVERFDEELDRGTDNLVDDLKRLIRANMEEEIERFSKALVENHILPEDF